VRRHGTIAAMSAVTIPILPSRDLDETVAFYASLGFGARGRWPEYLILARNEPIEIHFWLDRDVVAERNDVACYVRFTSAGEAQALYDTWAPIAAGWSGRFPRLVAPRSTDYGLLELALLDPHGNLVRIGGAVTAA
jgi:hypothetical protein